jgi:hypothetical protein
MVCMAARDDGSSFKSSEARGERAWKEATDAVASKNVAAQKAGKQEREAYERVRDEARRASALARDAHLMKRRGS